MENLQPKTPKQIMAIYYEEIFDMEKQLMHYSLSVKNVEWLVLSK